MTVGAVILGLLGAAIILCLNYLLQDTFLLTGFTSGGLMPVGVLVLMLLGALLVCLAGRGRRWGRFQPGELAAIFLLLTTACGVLGGGVPATFTPVLLMPVDCNEQRPSWRKNQLLLRGHGSGAARSGGVPPAVTDIMSPNVLTGRRRASIVASSVHGVDRPHGAFRCDRKWAGELAAACSGLRANPQPRHFGAGHETRRRERRPAETFVRQTTYPVV